MYSMTTVSCFGDQRSVINGCSAGGRASARGITAVSSAGCRYRSYFAAARGNRKTPISGHLEMEYLLKYVSNCAVNKLCGLQCGLHNMPPPPASGDL